jgi:hypothetical protein
LEGRRGKQIHRSILFCGHIAVTGAFAPRVSA